MNLLEELVILRQKKPRKAYFSPGDFSGETAAICRGLKALEEGGYLVGAHRLYCPSGHLVADDLARTEIGRSLCPECNLYYLPGVLRLEWRFLLSQKAAAPSSGVTVPVPLTHAQVEWIYRMGSLEEPLTWNVRRALESLPVSPAALLQEPRLEGFVGATFGDLPALAALLRGEARGDPDAAALLQAVIDAREDADGVHGWPAILLAVKP